MFLHFAENSGCYRHFGEIFCGIVRSLQILRAGRGVVRHPGSPENGRKKNPRIDSRILHAIDIEEEDAHEEDHKEDKDDKDEDNEDENQDEFENQE